MMVKRVAMWAERKTSSDFINDQPDPTHPRTSDGLQEGRLLCCTQFRYASLAQNACHHGLMHCGGCRDDKRNECAAWTETSVCGNDGSSHPGRASGPAS